MFLAASMGFVACSDDDNPTPPPTGSAEGTIEGQITGSRTLSADTVYTLKGYVRVMDGGSLTIEAGTLIKGDKATKAALIVERGGQIHAQGTAEDPIVFTSNQPKGSRAIGDWAGVIIAGKAHVNTADGTGQYEGGVLGTGVAAYGGTNDADNSGEFYYVRIEYAGIPIEVDKEINGLTLCGVGSATQVHHVQVSFGGDDGFEFFGGSVSAHHLVAYRTTDDDFDFDQGYNGSLQFGISVKDPGVADDAGTSRGIELENKGSVTGDVYSRPVISNFTFVGPGADGGTRHGAGVHFGLNSRFVFRNNIVVNAKTVAVEINGQTAADALLSNTAGSNAELKNNLLFGIDGDFKVSNATGLTVDLLRENAVDNWGNTILAAAADAGIESIDLSSLNLKLKTGATAKTGANFEGLTGLTTVAYQGAMDTEDWTAGWANWDPQNTDY
ncbi:T9SS C-terminal target domain-containing protein [Chitinophaga japonensis]|uniref:T9SS C-terminal target domain-containing protein n=1 Tax=Chitinophaga japonensis TaxID=104662 RepID=UPI00119FE601